MIDKKAGFISLVLFCAAMAPFGTTGTAMAGGEDIGASHDASAISDPLQYANDAIARYRPLKCKKSKSPLFRAGPSDLLELEIISDFRRINADTYDEEGGDSGVISYLDKKNRRQYVPVFIKDRGNSRRDSCEWVPLRITFESPKVKKKLDRSLGDSSRDGDRLVRTYNELKAMRKGVPLLKGTSQKDNIFRKLGDDIKIVTHCGKSTWRHVGGDTKEEQENRLLQEYYIYQVLDQMKSTTLKTRLAEITYRDPGGNLLLTRKAFFREPKSKLAKRCGLSNKSYPGVAVKGFNKTSLFQLELFNQFVYSKDYDLEEESNINVLYGKDGQKYVGPYDFDLSGIIAPEYRPNRKTVEENLKENFQPWLKSRDGDEMAIVQIFFMVRKKAKMRNVLTSSLLNEEKKAHMLNWFDSYMAALEQFLERNRALKPELIKGLELWSRSKKKRK